jgi:outer membrane biosynthesis protein TonB
MQMVQADKSNAGPLQRKQNELKPKKKTMKTTSTLIATLLLFISLVPARAASGPESSSLRDEIQKQMRYPDFAKNEHSSGLVLVKYEVHSDGRVEVIQMNASDSLWAGYVQQKLESLYVVDPALVGVHHAKFVFRYQTN